MSWFLASGGQSTGASASWSVLPMNIQGWFPLGLTGLVSLLSKELFKSFLQDHISKVSILWCSDFFMSNSHVHTWLLKNHSFNYMDVEESSWRRVLLLQAYPAVVPKLRSSLGGITRLSPASCLHIGHPLWSFLPSPSAALSSLLIPKEGPCSSDMANSSSSGKDGFLPWVHEGSLCFSHTWFLRTLPSTPRLGRGVKLALRTFHLSHLGAFPLPAPYQCGPGSVLQGSFQFS